MKNNRSNNVFIATTKTFNEKILSPWRWKLLKKHLSPYFGKSKTILDIGSGDGGLANEIQKEHRVKITGVDPHPQSKTFIPVIAFDGKTLPFADETFEMTMISDVLHHDKNPQMILREAKRVSKKYILIKDHYWTNSIDFSLLKWTDYLGNASYGVNLPYNYLTMVGWKKLFETNNLRIIEQKMFRYNVFDPCRHVIFLLEKTNRDHDK